MRKMPYFGSGMGAYDVAASAMPSTRRVLGMGLAAAANAPIPDPSYGIFRM